MKKLILIIALLIPGIGFSQKLHKFNAINAMPLTLNPLIFDPDQDTTIVFIEFLQDTALTIRQDKDYELNSRNYADINRSENFEQVLGIGFIWDYRVDSKHISVIIKAHHINGDITIINYIEKIDKLLYYEDFKWVSYSVDVEIFYEGEEDEVHSM